MLERTNDDNKSKRTKSSHLHPPRWYFNKSISQKPFDPP